MDLARMAASGGVGDRTAGATAPGTADGPRGRTLVVLHGFPLGLDERGIAGVRLLADEGPAAGVDLLLVADPTDVAMAGEAAGAVWQSAIRLVPVPDDCMGDPWVGLVWTFTPDVAGSDAPVAAVLTGLADARGGPR
jgi:hypothetical protein